jgi:hypothetical protein
MVRFRFLEGGDVVVRFFEFLKNHGFSRTMGSGSVKHWLELSFVFSAPLPA